MSDGDLATLRLLREIQGELADLRDDRTVLISILNRHDASLDGLIVELRALRSQLDRFRNEARERLGIARVEEQLDHIARMVTDIARKLDA